MRRAVLRCWLPGLCVLLASGCAPGGDEASTSDGAAVRALIDAGRFDEALERVGAASGPEARLLAGLALAGKARAAEIPASGVASPEARQAVATLDQVTAPAASRAEAQLAKAELLAPFAAAAVAPPDENATPTPTPAPVEEGAEPTPTPEPPVAVETVVEAFRIAVGDEATRLRALDAFAAFCLDAACQDAVDQSFGELVERLPQDQELPALYGAFLVSTGDRARALEQYGIALIWRPDDPELRGRVADIHLDQAYDHLEWGEYPQAEKAFQESRAYIPSNQSPQWRRLKEGLERLDRIRPGRR